MKGQDGTESREQREENLRALGRFFRRANTIWVAVVFVLIPWIFPGTEPVRFYGLCGLVVGNGLRWWYFSVIAWCDRTGRDWDGGFWFIGATLVAAMATTAFVYASIGVYDHALDDWPKVFSFSTSRLTVAFIVAGLMSTVLALWTTAITHYRRDEHLILRGRPANKFWHIVLVVVMPLVIVLGISMAGVLSQDGDHVPAGHD